MMALLLATVEYGLRVLLWFASVFVPKDQSLVLFQGTTLSHYTGNSRYLFEYLSRQSSLRPVWITSSPAVWQHLRDLGLRVEYHRSLRGLCCYLRARAVIGSGTTHPNFLGAAVGTRAVKLCLHHGAGPRSTNAGIDPAERHRTGSRMPTASEIIQLLHEWDYVNFPSPFAETMIGKLQYLLPKQKRIQLGYPRCDPLFDRASCEQRRVAKTLLRRLLPMSAAERVWLYAPTWRIDNTGLSFPLARLPGFSLQAFDRWLAEQGAYLVVSVHPLVQTQELFHGCEHIAYLPQDPLLDINEVLPEIDILLTDYSSVMTDFALMDRPIVLVMPDYQNFLLERGLLEDIRLHPPGQDVTTYDALLQALRSYGDDPRLDHEQRQQYLQRYYDPNLAGAAERCHQFLRSQMRASA